MLAFAAGKVAKRIKIPRVTAFILVGLFLGPSFADLIDKHMVHDLEFISQIALGLILFNIGGEFHRAQMKKIAKETVLMSGMMAIMIFSTVFILVFSLLTFFTESGLPERMFISSLLGMIAMDAAPPTTLLVIKEYDSQGPLTDHIIVFLAFGAVFAIVGSQSIVITAQATGFLESDQSPLLLVAQLGWTIFGSILAGHVLGFGLSYLEQKEKNSSDTLMAVIITILISVALKSVHLEPLLISLMLGFTLVNTSHAGEEIHDQVKNVGLSIYALFFILAGAHISIEELKHAGVLGIIYIIARIGGIWFSAFVTGKFFKTFEKESRIFGFGLMSHAGVALGIVVILNEINSTMNIEAIKQINNAVIAAVFLFEILGPILLRLTLVRAREVKVSGLLTDPSTGISLSLGEMIENYLVNTGLRKDHHDDVEAKISELMTRKIYSVQASANFGEVVKYIDTHHFPIYPVVDKDGTYRGMLDLKAVKNTLFDPYLSKFVNASDLIGLRTALDQKTGTHEAEETFKECGLDAIPVINDETKKLVGILRIKDVLVSLKKT